MPVPGQPPEDIEPTTPADEEQKLRVVIVDPKDIPPASLARIRTHAQELAIQLGRTETD